MNLTWLNSVFSSSLDKKILPEMTKSILVSMLNNIGGVAERVLKLSKHCMNILETGEVIKNSH